MTNSELKQKLEQARELLSDVYHWAITPMSNGLQVLPLSTNSEEIESLMSVADGCISDALSELEDV